MIQIRREHCSRQKDPEVGGRRSCRRGLSAERRAGWGQGGSGRREGWESETGSSCPW